MKHIKTLCYTLIILFMNTIVAYADYLPPQIIDGQDCYNLYDVVEIKKGTQKNISSLIYGDGKEFYRLDYKTNPNYYYDRCLEVCEYRNDFHEVIKDKMPYEVGEYELIYQYSSYGYSKNINYFAGNPLPIKYYHDTERVKLIIQE